MLKQDIKILSIDEIRQVVDRAEQTLFIPEWNGAVKLRAWSLEERDRVMAQCSPSGKLDGTQPDPVKLVHLCVTHGVIEPKLTEEIICDKNWVIIDRISKAVMELNGLTKGAALTTSMTFRPESGPAVPVPAGEGPEENGARDPQLDDRVGVPAVG